MGTERGPPTLERPKRMILHIHCYFSRPTCNDLFQHAFQLIFRLNELKRTVSGIGNRGDVHSCTEGILDQPIGILEMLKFRLVGMSIVGTVGVCEKCVGKWITGWMTGWIKGCTRECQKRCIRDCQKRCIERWDILGCHYI